MMTSCREKSRQDCNRKAERLTEGHVSLSCRDAGAGLDETQRAVVASEDDAGTIMVKRYRLVLPGER